MPALAAVLLPALLPPLADALGMGFKWLFGGKGEPQTVDDRVKIMDAESRVLKARGDFLGSEGFGDLSAWAGSVDLKGRPWLTAWALVTILTPRAMREATRPALAWSVVYAAIALAYLQNPYAAAMIDMAASVFSLYFGDRMYGYIKGRIGGGVSK